MDTALNVVTDRAEWLERRKNGIGASEAAAALGLSPWSSPRELYLQKLGQAPPVEETEAMRWGNLLEPLIADEYSRRTGYAVVGQQLWYEHPVETHLFATLDGMTDQGWPVEFKTVGAFNAKEIGEEGTDELPEHWTIQAHQQMFLSDTDRVDFAVLIGGQRLQIHPVHRNEALIKEMVPRLASFWRCVQHRELPEFMHRADRKLFRLLYPECEGEIDLSPLDQQTVDAWLETRADRKKIEDIVEVCRTAVLDLLKNNAIGYLPDGRIVTRKIIKVAEQQVTHKAYDYVDLRVRKGVPR